MLGPEFEPYLPIVMPPLLEAAGRNADPIILRKQSLLMHTYIILITLATKEVEELEDSQAWKTITYGEKTVGVRSSAMEEKSLALHTIYTYCMTLQSLLGPYLTQCLEAVIPTLQSWFDPITKMTCGMQVFAPFRSTSCLHIIVGSSLYYYNAERSPVHSRVK